MWKESYRLGIDSIDQQHKALFKMVEGLLAAIERGAGKEEYSQAIAFLKGYVVRHFSDEEEYQASIHYPGLEAHRAAHQKFTETVLAYEKELVKTGYSLHVVKSLAGTLTAWLIYHVADADQKIVRGADGAARAEGAARPGGDSQIGYFAASAAAVLEKMAGLPAADIRQTQAGPAPVGGDIFVKVGLSGQAAGAVYFGFTEGFACSLMEAMTFCKPETVDELTLSALAEFSNIVCGNAVTSLAAGGTACGIEPPVVSLEAGAWSGIPALAALLTPFGRMELTIAEMGYISR